MQGARANYLRKVEKNAKNLRIVDWNLYIRLTYYLLISKKFILQRKSAFLKKWPRRPRKIRAKKFSFFKHFFAFSL